MKSVLISIQPKWCELIAKGKKTVEVRKTRPNLPTPFKCYIYCTLSGSNEFFKDSLDGDVVAWNRGKWGERKGNVIGEFICDRIDYTTKGNIKAISEASCVSVPDLWEYGRNSSAYDLYGWHVSDLVIYDKPKVLREFYKECAGLYNTGMCYECEKAVGEECECATNGRLFITRPPQSWCYVEDLQNEHT